MEPDSAGLVLIDPPYNVGKKYAAHDDAMDTALYWLWRQTVLSAAARVSRDAVVWFPGAVNAFDAKDALAGTPLRPVRMLGWRRREFAGDSWGTGPALSWEPIVWASKAERPGCNRVYGHMGRDFLDVPCVRMEPFRSEHPCVKPLLVMRWLVGLFAPPGAAVVDPCCGTGTTLEAARAVGRPAIGIELSADYCAMTVRRLQQSVLPL